MRPRPAVLTAREVYHSNSYGSCLGGQRTVRLMGTLRRFGHICQDVEDWFDVPSASRTRASLSGAALALVRMTRSTTSFGDEGSTSNARTGTCGREGKRRALWILGSRVRGDDGGLVRIGVLCGFRVPAFAGMTDGLVGFGHPLRGVRAGLKPAPTLFVCPLRCEGEGTGVLYGFWFPASAGTTGVWGNDGGRSCTSGKVFR